MIFRSPYPDVSIPEISLSDLVLRNASLWENRPAFIDAPSGRTLTYGQVAAASRKAASSLAERGLRRGDVFAVCCPNAPEYAVAFHAVIMLGGVITPMNPVYTTEELAFQLKDTKARYILTMPNLLEKITAAADGCCLREIFVIGNAEGATSFDSLMQGNGLLQEISIDVKTDLAVLPYSSGTSGRPKGVMLTHYNMVSLLRQLQPILHLGPSDSTLGMLPFFHIFGMNILMNNALYRGYTCVVTPRFDFLQVLELIERYKITHLFVVPPIAAGLARAPEVRNYDLSSLRFVLSGAAPLDSGIQKALSERLQIPVLQGYGMTETCLAVTMTPEDHPKFGSGGRLIPNLEAKVVDTVSGIQAGTGVSGEIWVRGPNVMEGYLNNVEETRNAFDNAEWLRTGDLGYFDEDGFLFVVDRAKELIKYKGMQVAPAELEGLLLTHPAIADAAVVPSPDREAGEIPKAFVVLKAPCTPDEIMSFVADRVAPYKKIRQVSVIDAIPKSTTGKVLRRVLVEQERSKLI